VVARRIARRERGADVDSREPLWDIQEAAAYLKLSVGAVYRMTGPKAGLKIPHIKLSSRLRFRRPEIDEWLSLLSISNLDLLSKARAKAQGVRRGHNS
jgi:excisionase family DNA binding protein